MKTRAFSYMLWMVLPLLILLGMPGQGFSTLIQTEYFQNSALGNAPLAQVDVTVYGPGELTSYAGGSLQSSDYLYQYTIKNIDDYTKYHSNLPYPVSIKMFALDLKVGAPVIELWPAASGTYIPDFDPTTGDVHFSVLNLAPGASIDLYIVSSAAPELVTGWFMANLGGSGGKSLWAPDPAAPPLNSPVPEPGTLLLLGSGLIGAALVKRRRRLGKRR